MKYNNLVAKVAFGLGLAQLACAGGIWGYALTDPQTVEMTKMFHEQTKLEHILEGNLNLNPEELEKYTKAKEEYIEVLTRNEFAKVGYRKLKMDLLMTAAFVLPVSSIMTMELSASYMGFYKSKKDK